MLHSLELVHHVLLALAHRLQRHALPCLPIILSLKRGQHHRVAAAWKGERPEVGRGEASGRLAQDCRQE